MSDEVLSQEEIENLLKGNYPDDSVSTKEGLAKRKPILSRDQIERLIKTHFSGVAVDDKRLKGFEEHLQGIEKFKML
ncbi:hypothetical protein AGMMS49928_28230 [Spirochaetia bacterium]|nr:hypothetical protein AGMMS49928_28230 [Spirochaetia bacterium]